LEKSRLILPDVQSDVFSISRMRVTAFSIYKHSTEKNTLRNAPVACF